MGKKATTGAANGRHGGKSSAASRLRKAFRQQTQYKVIKKLKKSKRPKHNGRVQPSPRSSKPSAAVMAIGESIADALGLDDDWKQLFTVAAGAGWAAHEPPRRGQLRS